MKLDKTIYAVLILGAVFNILTSTYILVNQANGQRSGLKQRITLQKSTDRIECILLINPSDRSKETIKECDR